MKTKIITKLIGLLLVAVSSNVLAQDVLPTVTVTSTSNVNAKVTSIFNKEFKDAENIRWTKLKRDYVVDFITKDMNNKALYGKRGNRIYHIAYGKEKHLPNDVRHAIKSTYYDYNITGTYHVKQDRRDIWIANLEGNKKHIMVRMENDGLEEVLNFEDQRLIAQAKQ